MPRLELLFKQFDDAINRLQDALHQEKNEYIRDAAIQRFEFCFELSWKVIKAYLEEELGIICRSPKGCFREAYKQELVKYDEDWLKLTDLRNQIAHTYNEQIAEKIYQRLPHALESFKNLLDQLQKKRTP